jgi:hypothetical protein
MDLYPLIAGLIVVLIGLYIFIRGFTKWSHYNTVSNTPTSKVEAIAAGFVEVYGEAVAKGDYLKSPFCGEDCVFYKYIIEEYRHHGRSSSWVIIRQGQSEPPFFIQDETGKIEVDPVGAELEVVEKSRFEVNPGDETPETILDFLKTVNLRDNTPTMNFWPFHMGGNPRMYTEYKIDKGQSVFVTGTAVPKEGVISEKHEDTLVIKKGDLNKFFYISDKKEKAVLGGIRNKAIEYFVAGGIVALVGLAYIFFVMGML